MPLSLDRIIAHARARNRPNTHDAILVREIERLRTLVADLTDARDHLMAMRAVDAGQMPLLTEAEVDAFLAAKDLPGWRNDAAMQLVEDMAGPTVAWAQLCARRDLKAPGEFRTDHQELIDRINWALASVHAAPTINRLEVIDQTGRIFVAHETLSDVRLSYQDDGRTLKVFCTRSETPKPHRSFTTAWSEEDGEFVGTCDQFPSLSHLATDEGAALAGIMRLVAEVDADMATPGLDDGCCHKTRLRGAGCPIGRTCPHTQETPDV